MEDHNELVNVVLLEYKQKQFRLEISEFRGSLYLSIREWYQGFEGNFQPSNNGFTIPYTLHSTSALYNGLVTVLSKAETLSEVKKSNVEELVKQTQLFALVSKELGISTSDKIEILESDLDNRTITLGVLDEEH
jgi:hypothetical protein